MDPTTVTLSLQAAFALLAFGWRTVAQHRATGSTGVVVHRERGAVAKTAGLLLVAGLLAVVAGTAAAAPRPWGPAAVLGTGGMLAGLAVTLSAQRTMGSAWRIGVDPTERTELVTAGPFRHVRNPIFTGMLLFAAGCVTAVPTALTVLGLAAALAGTIAQVRRVEEPHLRRQHGAVYGAYLARTGRFLPRLGREAFRSSR